ncbi:MAG: hypothetical protein U5K54_09115 [Cytophagales bacterium]|nr:hypothetical protein [Cytophagales bacterium]
MYVMRDYDVTEEKAGEIRKEIERRKQVPEKKTSSYSQTDRLRSFAKLNFTGHFDTDTNFASKTETEIKALFTASLHKGMHGLCFSPYLEGQNIGDQLSESQIRQRMDVIAPYTKWVRSFSCSEGNESYS